ncbi:MAG: VCBS repeat-containing protein [Planctomycetes bacterium]|nr:VCBS repeat-containing protein [Planctomycetota bacterium]
MPSLALPEPARAGQSGAPLNFQDVTAQRVVPTVPEPDGPHVKEVDFGDFDHDDDLDVVIGVAEGIFGSRVNKLYRNDDGVFVEVSGDPVIPEFGDPDVTRHIGLRDVDGDGWLDIVVVNDAFEFGDPIDVFINQHPGGVFTHYTEEGQERGLGFTNDWPCGSVSVDVDQDGDIDIFVSNYPAQDSMYVNDGNGFFTDVTATRVPTDNEFSIDTAAGDLNGDGKIDMLISNSPDYGSAAEYRIYYNDLNGESDQGVGDYRYGPGGTAGVQSLGVVSGHGAMEPGDFNQDGMVDMYWTRSPHDGLVDTEDVILLNVGNDADGMAQFDVLAAPSYVQSVNSHKVTVADLNGDGRDDLIVMTSDRPAILRNASVNGVVYFVDWTPAPAFPSGTIHAGAHAVAFDSGGDGDLDIFLGGDTGDHLFENVATPEVEDDDLVDGVLPDLIDAEPLSVTGTLAAGESREYSLPLDDVVAGGFLSVIVNGTDDLLLEVLHECVPAASSDRGGVGVEEALQFEFEGGSIGIRLTSLGAGGDFTLELLGRSDDGIIPPSEEGWAAEVIDFSSEYSSTDWSAQQALGAPDTFAYGDIPTAWAPLEANGGPEYLTLGFTPHRFSTGVTVRETFGNGFVSEIEVLDVNDELHTVWTGVDPSRQGQPVDFLIEWAQTEYLVKGVTIHVDTSSSSSWEEIDAVQLHGPVPKEEPRIDCNDNGVPDACDIAGGTSMDRNRNGIPDECESCEGDANGDGTVDPLDVGFVLARFGCVVGSGDPNCDTADMNGDGAVNPLDSGFVLARFGDCP